MKNDSATFYNFMLQSLAEHQASKEKLNADDIKNDIAIKLKFYRAKHKLSQDELAAKLGVTRRQLVRWEARANKASNLAIQKMKELKIL